MEMIKWFRLPVNCELSINGETSISDSVVITGYDVLSSHHVEKVEIAINSYDANQKLIARQAEKIKVLLSALELVRPEIYYNQDGVEVEPGGNMILTADGDADNEAMQKIHEALEFAKD